MTRVRQALAGKQLFVTGATGFLGTALVERLLRAVPDSRVVLLIRPGRRSDASQRASREILRNDCFDRLRAIHGDRFDAEVSARVTAIAGDVTLDGLGLDAMGMQLLSECDLVVHSAAAVAFDSPLDSAVEINLLGPSRVAAAVVSARSLARSQGRRGPVHYLPVSTAYVAGTHQGEAAERVLGHDRFTIDVDWRSEVDAARRSRSDADAESRRPKALAGFTKEARRELGPAGIHLLAGRAERLREEWVRNQMVTAGQSRAQSLGWPDAYPYTKALGERALVSEFGPTVPMTIIRPSIIESALAEPRPGWIRGFRMAEPIIVSYAKGLLREFPGVPEGVIDVIPVDLVAAAILAVGAEELLNAAGRSAADPAASAADPAPPSDDPAPTEPNVYHVASGVRNPLHYGRLVELVQSWFTDHPIYDGDGQPIVVPAWSFPGRGRVQRQLTRANQAMGAAERIFGSLPLRGRRAAWIAALEERHLLVERALGYVELYGAYTETEARYRVDRLMGLWDRMDGDDRAILCFDPASVDWDRYVTDIHLPSVVEHARVKMTPGRSAQPGRIARSRSAVLSPERQLAAFDLENTLVASNVVDSFAWLASRHLPPAERIAFVSELLHQAPALLLLDRRDRGDFLRSFYRRYEGAPADRLRDDAWELFNDLLLAKSFPAGIARVRKHRALGHRTVLITGALDLVVEPLRPLFDDVVCARLSEAEGRFTGRLGELPPIGEARALLLAEYARAEGLRLEQSMAYADSSSDLPMLEVVGYPVAVNPEAKLAAIARRRGWLVEHWDKAPGGSRPFLPLGPFDRRRYRSPAAPTATTSLSAAALSASARRTAHVQRP
ncbi:MAG: HAD-IB family phosphatase [Acidimicrobiales bacterium]